ncbi:MAG: hypothetical protein U0599_29080 [Vicinamibacteria bacterium]
MNALKSPVTRARNLWQKRILGPRDAWLKPVIADYLGELLGDKPDASAGERRVAEAAALARAAAVLLLAEAARRPGGLAADLATVSFPNPRDGAMTIKRAQQDLLSGLARFLKLEVSALSTLGLERRQREVDPLRAIEAAVRRANEGQP